MSSTVKEPGLFEEREEQPCEVHRLLNEDTKKWEALIPQAFRLDVASKSLGELSKVDFIHLSQCFWLYSSAVGPENLLRSKESTCCCALKSCVKHQTSSSSRILQTQRRNLASIVSVPGAIEASELECELSSFGLGDHMTDMLGSESSCWLGAWGSFPAVLRDNAVLESNLGLHTCQTAFQPLSHIPNPWFTWLKSLWLMHPDALGQNENAEKIFWRLLEQIKLWISA